VVLGYVVMPEHVHLLVSEPQRETLSIAIQALKLGFVHILEVAFPGLAKAARPGAPPARVNVGSQNTSGRRGFMILMFGPSLNVLKNCDTYIAIQ
jgi:REP element-mobilizing transposase RayT